jgi:hypothetical protein
MIAEHEAKVNVTYGGQNGDLPDPVAFDSTDGDVRGWVSEALRGGIPGIDAQEVDLTDFVVDRFSANEARPYNLIQLRPKVPFGSVSKLAENHSLDEVVELITKDGIQLDHPANKERIAEYLKELVQWRQYENAMNESRRFLPKR